MAEIVGGALTAVTVNVKFVEASSVPSSTVMVMVLVPLWPAAGVMVTVLLAPLPPKEIPAGGTRVVLLELPVTVRLPAAVSASPMVKAMALVGVSCAVDWSVMADMVGAVFAATTTRSKSVLVDVVPSLTVMVMVVVPL